MNEKLGYLMSALDLYLSNEIDPVEAWNKALENYAYVYHYDDGRLPIAKASEIALNVMIKKRPLWKRALALPKTWHGHYKLYRKHHGRIKSFYLAWVLSKLLLNDPDKEKPSVEEGSEIT